MTFNCEGNTKLERFLKEVDRINEKDTVYTSSQRWVEEGLERRPCCMVERPEDGSFWSSNWNFPAITHRPEHNIYKLVVRGRSLRIKSLESLAKMLSIQQELPL